MDIAEVTAFFEKLWDEGLFLQLTTTILGFFCAQLLYVVLGTFMGGRFSRSIPLLRFRKIMQPIAFPLGLALMQWTIVAAAREFQWGSSVNEACAKLATAWLATRCLSLLKIQPEFKRLATFTMYTVTVLALLGLLPRLLEMMEHFSLEIGDLHLSLLSTLKGASLFFVLLWGTLKASTWLERSFQARGSIDPSHQELLKKLIKVSFVTFSILVSLSLSGINLSLFTVFGGAVGVGIGFGLQKIVSNFICGIILLLDRSIKPGDVVALPKEKSYGQITKLGARCVTVRTRCGKEHLIPNEEFITHKSENWSYSDNYIRLSLPMRAGLDSDVRLVMRLLLEATECIDRVTEEKAPGARLRGFSDSAIEFELRVWIKDPKNGLSKVKSDIYVKIWELFMEHGITIPHAQRDLHFQPNPNTHVFAEPETSSSPTA